MADFSKTILRLSVLLAIGAVDGAFGAQPVNPRSNASSSGRSAMMDSNTMVRRSATNIIARSAESRPQQVRDKIVSSRKNASRTAVVRSPRSTAGTAIGVAKASRVATNSVAKKSPMARTATNAKVIKATSGAKVSRAAKSRATAVFNDISKIGGGYSSCRDSYATCMDQFCANANETYRRCFCSDRFVTFRDTADALDTALKMLSEFQDNNLNAVDKTAAEVNAMYTATAGEEAIKKDTSASQQLLDSIADVLSGKKVETKKTNNSSSLGVLDISSFSSGFDDVWGDSSSSSLFGGSSDNSSDMSSMEGKELYTSANSQCAEITREACSSDAMFNLAKSAYSIMITQDCNMYEKNINAKKESVQETVRTAEKYLRDARLEEYRSHNSADVNECLAKVETAIKQPTACGSNYEKCMDYTGLYINSTTGEPIYSQALFKLNDLIVLDGSADVLGSNADFNKMLDDKKMFVSSALDSCRDIADTVWYEFKRSAIIQIAQAQDAKIQSVKDSCVVTIKECYDTQSGGLKELDTTEAQSTGAIAAVTARGMCYDKVQACAALYGDPDGCAYDDKTKKLTAVSGKKCGLQSLLAFVDTVDSVKVAEGCEAALTKYAKELCPDTKNEDGSTKLKYGECGSKSKKEIRAAMESRVKTFCAQDLVASDESNTISGMSSFNLNIMNQVIKDIFDELQIGFSVGCEELDESDVREKTASGEFETEEAYQTKGVWYDADAMSKPNINLLYAPFYRKYYGMTTLSLDAISRLNLEDKGWCLDSSKVKGNSALKDTCESFGGKVDEEKQMCTLPDDFYKLRCCQLGGDWKSNSCEINNWPQDVGKKNCDTLRKASSGLSKLLKPIKSIAEKSINNKNVGEKLDVPANAQLRDNSFFSNIREEPLSVLK